MPSPPLSLLCPSPIEVTLRHGDTTTAVAIKCFGGIDGQGTWTAASRPLMRSEQLRQRWKGVADTPGARIAVPCRGFSEWTHDFFVPPVPGAVFYLAALRYQGGFAFLTRDSSGFAPLEFHHRTLIALDEAGAVAWVTAVIPARHISSQVKTSAHLDSAHLLLTPRPDGGAGVFSHAAAAMALPASQGYADVFLWDQVLSEESRAL